MNPYYFASNTKDIHRSQTIIITNTKQRETVKGQYGKWVHCKVDGARSAETEWTQKYVVIDQNGTMTLFEDDAMKKENESFDLTFLSLDDVTASHSDSKSTSFRISMKTENPREFMKIHGNS